ncbi:MAG: hydrogenase maturation protease [Bacteroidota bacterium]
MNDFQERFGKTLILGIGNEILTDDAIGLRLVDDLQACCCSPRLVFEKATVGGLEILELIKGYKAVLFLDAIKTVNGTPGDVYRMSFSDFADTLHLSNLHDVGFIEAIRLGEALGLSLPETLLIFAVEIVEDRVFSSEFTPAIESRYPRILMEAERFLRQALFPSKPVPGVVQ